MKKIILSAAALLFGSSMAFADTFQPGAQVWVNIMGGIQTNLNITSVSSGGTKVMQTAVCNGGVWQMGGVNDGTVTITCSKKLG